MAWTPRQFVIYRVKPQLEMYEIEGLHRILLAFSNMEQESEKQGDAVYRAYGGGEHAAEVALDIKIDHYQKLTELRQAMINMLVVSLYHLFEQHQNEFNWLITDQATFSDLPTWPKVEELRLAANAVKHAEGPSAEQLRKLRPDLFVAPPFTMADFPFDVISDPITNPLGGVDVYLSADDFKEYREALDELWWDVLGRV